MLAAPGRLCLPQRLRLRSRRDFQNVYTRGRRAGGPKLAVWALPAASTRVAFVASRRVGRAVARNRAKRLMREAFRRNQRVLSGSFHIVMVARSACARSTGSEVESELLRQLRRLGCLRRLGAGSAPANALRPGPNAARTPR